MSSTSNLGMLNDLSQFCARFLNNHCDLLRRSSRLGGSGDLLNKSLEPLRDGNLDALYGSNTSVVLETGIGLLGVLFFLLVLFMNDGSSTGSSSSNG